MKRLLKVNAGVRYPENATVNGNEETNEKPTMPFLSLVEVTKESIITGKPYTEKEWRWQFEIDVETGTILNWQKGTKAVSYYKVCDDCEVEYFEDGKFVCNNDGEYYVPDCLCLDDEGYGDYMDLTIDENGQIQNWSIKKVEDWIKRHLDSEE